MIARKGLRILRNLTLKLIRLA